MNTQQSIDRLAQSLGEVLLDLKWKVATAESCTGGGVAQAITERAGSSQWFELGLVTYSNAMKIQYLGVAEQLLLQHGAVSEPTVEAMLKGVISCSGANLAVSISGIAGPSGAVPGKPVGTVCFAWGAKEHYTSATEHFTGSRTEVRRQAVAYALERLLDFAKNTV